MEKKRSVAVVGAGIVGLPTALNIIETLPNVDVTLISDKFSPDTTGDGSAGVWEPYLVYGTPEHKLKKWGQDTFTHFCRIANSADAAEAGTFLLGGYKLFNNKPKDLKMPYWKDTVLGFHEMTESELNLFPKHIRYGWAYTSAISECTKYLPWTEKKFRSKGGLVLKRKVNDLKELVGSYDVIVNCTGLGARECARDSGMEPLRGQVIRVRAPFAKMFIWMEDEGLYMLPNGDTVVLGGTHDKGQWNTIPDPVVRDQIYQGCCKILPQLKGAEHVADWSGLRPVREGLRLERETIEGVNGAAQVVHNYGHGGSGVTLHWGCALEATRLCEEALRDLQSPSSKL